jgi:5-methylcytosine-specific restriction enzyme A
MARRQHRGSPLQDPTRWREWSSHRKWKRIRALHLKAHPLCAFCQAQGKAVAADVVDHVIEHAGDINAFFTGELRSLCRPCHERRHGRAPGGTRPWIGLDGWPLDEPSPAAPANRKRQDAVNWLAALIG